MKNEIRLALLFLAATAVPAFGQNPQCGSTNYDQSRNLFTVMNAAADAVNQQCFITVYPAGAMPAQARQNSASYFVEGTYVVELSGGGGGGGGGASGDKGGGGGGAGAAPMRTVQYLAPAVYKLTIGTGGVGGSADGGRTQSGNPSSLTNASTGQLIAGFAGADTWTQRSRPASDGRGGAARPGGSAGGSGGDSGPSSEAAAQSGGASQTGGFAGRPGQAGSETGSRPQADAGGGGGASAGSGGRGESDAATRGAAAGTGDLGGGGGGGRGGRIGAHSGAQGGHGFIKLALQTAAVGQASTPAVIERGPTPASSARPVRSDRN